MTKHLGLLMTDDLAQRANAGQKTVTRRPLALPRLKAPDQRWAPDWPDRAVPDETSPWGPHLKVPFQWMDGGRVVDEGIERVYPRIPGAGVADVGGLVWVRECFCVVLPEYPCGSDKHNEIPEYPYISAEALAFWRDRVRYRAAADDRLLFHMREDGHSWKPSIHMPKWAARTWGRIVSVRPERVQDITEADARREGFQRIPGAMPQQCGMDDPSARAMFRACWRACYPGSWERNDWVWRIEWEPCVRPAEVTT